MSDYSVISFPSLGIELDPSRTLNIGPLSINMYGLIIAFGLLMAVLYACRRSKQFGLKNDDLMDGVLFIVPFAIICARLYYCIFQWDSYQDNPVEILYIWKGGLAIYGGVIGAALGIIVFSKVKKVHIGAVLDITALGFLIGQSIGRWGNFFNREAFGAETESFLRMGLQNARTGQVTYVHPTFLYESLWNAAGFVLIHFLSKRRKYDGQVALLYVAWYGLGRTFIEGLRQDSLYWGQLRVSQILAAVSCFAAVAALMAFGFFFQPDPAKMQVNKVEAAAEEPKEETAE